MRGEPTGGVGTYAIVACVRVYDAWDGAGRPFGNGWATGTVSS